MKFFRTQWFQKRQQKAREKERKNEKNQPKYNIGLSEIRFILYFHSKPLVNRSFKTFCHLPVFQLCNVLNIFKQITKTKFDFWFDFGNRHSALSHTLFGTIENKTRNKYTCAHILYSVQCHGKLYRMHGVYSWHVQVHLCACYSEALSHIQNCDSWSRRITLNKYMGKSD